MPQSPKPLLLWNLIWQPPGLLKAWSHAISHSHQQNQCPTPSLFPHIDRFWTELYHVCIWQGEPGSQTWAPAAEGAGEENCSDLCPGEDMGRLFKGEWLPEDLPGIVSPALMLVMEVFVCLVSSHCVRQKSTHPSLSKQALWMNPLKSHGCQNSLCSLELKVCRLPFHPHFLPGHSSLLVFTCLFCTIFIYRSLCSVNFYFPVWLWRSPKSLILFIYMYIYIFSSFKISPLLLSLSQFQVSRRDDWVWGSGVHVGHF